MSVLLNGQRKKGEMSIIFYFQCTEMVSSGSKWTQHQKKTWQCRKYNSQCINQLPFMQNYGTEDGAEGVRKFYKETNSKVRVKGDRFWNNLQSLFQELFWSQKKRTKGKLYTHSSVSMLSFFSLISNKTCSLVFIQFYGVSICIHDRSWDDFFLWSIQHRATHVLVF